MYKRLNKYLIILIVAILSVTFIDIKSVQAFNSATDIIKDSDKLEYKILDDGFEKSFFGGLVEKAKAILTNSQSRLITGTLYQDTSIDKVSIDGVGFTAEELKNNPEKLRQLFLDENKKDGLEYINISTKEYETYSYEEYLGLLKDNAQPINIATNTKWSKENGPYYIAGEVRVLNGAKLTIEAGTTVYFTNTPVNNNKSGILVDGELVINGTANNKVKLIPLNDNNINKIWKGIYVSERGSLQAKYTELDKAGAWSDSAIYSLGDLKLDNCTIKNTDGNGITAFKNAEITNCTVNNNSNYGIDLYRYNGDYKTIVTNNNITSNNTAARIVIRQAESSDYSVKNNIVNSNNINGFKLSPDLLGDITFTKPGNNVPYILVNHGDKFSLTEQFKVNRDTTVTFDKTIVKIEDNNGSHDKNKIIVDGTLNIIGTASENTIFTSLNNHSVLGDTANLGEVTPEVNDWDGIYVNEGGKVNIEYGDLSYASNIISSFGESSINNSKLSNSFIGVYTYNNKSKIENSKFDKIDKYAFNYSSMNGPADITLKNNSFTNMKYRIGKINLYKSGGSNIVATGNTSDNVNNGVDLTGNISINTTITNIGQNIPYVIPHLIISKDTTVNVDAGTIMKVEDGMLFGEKSCIDIYGKLLTNGTSDKNIVITSLKDDTIAGDTNGDGKSTVAENGDWGSINVLASRGANNATILNYTDIRYGGYNQTGYMLGGNGTLVVNNSIIKGSSEDGIKVTGELSLNSSKIIDNDKIGVHAKSDNNFDVKLNNNKFENNKEFAGFITFGSSSDKFSGANNTGVNNGINGVGLSGVLSANFTLSPAGNNFPFVIPEELVVESQSTLTITDGVITKFGNNAKLTLNGNLDINGTSSGVKFISLNDDSIAGDTNNNGENTKAAYGDWEGIIYSSGSEGFFDKFECKDSTYNMDYKNIPYVKAVAKADSNVSIYEDKAVYITSNGENKNVVLYNYSTGNETIIVSNSNNKKSAMIYGNYIAWIEGGNIGVYNISSKSKQYITASGLKSIYLNEGYLVWSGNSSLTYRNLSTGTDERIVNTVDDSFAPVISSKYLIYKSNDDGMYHRITLANKEDYYMLSYYCDHVEADIYGDNIALLTSDKRINIKNIVVGDIPSWTSVGVTSNVNSTSKYPALYKDKISYYTTSEKSIMIKQSDSNKEIENISILSIGYDVGDNDIGEKKAIFTDKDLVYLLKTNFGTSNNKFIDGNLSYNNGYDRKITLGNEVGIKIGLEVTAGTVVSGSAGVGFGVNNKNDISYILKSDSLNQEKAFGISRNQLSSGTLDSKLGFSIGSGDILEVSGDISGSTTKSKLSYDEYTFAKSDPEAYKKLGLLTAASIVEGIPTYFNPVGKIIKKVIANKLENSVDAVNTSLSYDRGRGIGNSNSIGTSVGISHSVVNLGGNITIYTDSLAKVGENKNSRYVSLESAFSGEIGRDLDLTLKTPEGFFGDLELGKYKFEQEYSTKIPFSFFSDITGNINISYKLDTNKNLIVTIIDNSSDSFSQEYTVKYEYIIKGSNYDYVLSKGLFGGLNDLSSNLQRVNNDLVLAKYVINNKGAITQNLNDLLHVLKNCNNIEYKITLNNEFSKSLDLAFDSSAEYKEDEKIAIIPTINSGITVNGTYSDDISLVIDSGIINKGVVTEENQLIAFIPVSNESTISLFKRGLAAFANQINPISQKYVNGLVELSDNGQKKLKIKSSNLSRATFIINPISKNGVLQLDDNNFILGDGIFVQSEDMNNNIISYYPSGSELTLYIDSNNWNKYYGKKFSIYEYDVDEDKWINLGGKIDTTNKSVTVPINVNSQYAIGVDISSPDITWQNNNTGSVLSANGTYYMNDGDSIKIKVIDNFSRHNNIVTVKEGTTIVEEYSTSSTEFLHNVSGEKGKKYEITVQHLDEFENSYRESINVIIN